LGSFVVVGGRPADRSIDHAKVGLAAWVVGLRNQPFKVLRTGTILQTSRQILEVNQAKRPGQ
jgi:hypothetical protein